MDYKEKQRLARESTKPKLRDPEDYTDHDKHVMAQMTAYYSRASRRKRPASLPKFTKKRASKRK